jgi:ribosome-binding factor A
VADQIQRELSDLIRNELKDPRVPALVTVAAVEVSKDLGHARVYVSMFDAPDRDEAVDALNNAAGFLRGQLGARIRMRTVPMLHFRYDDVQEHGAQLSNLIDSAVSSNTTSADDAGEQRD